MEERRKSNRIELISTLVVKRLDNGTDREAQIEIVDVSKTGIGFSCNELLEIGAVYEAFLRIWTQEVIHSFLEIVRIEKKGPSYNYGAVFIGMPEMDASRIEVYDTVESLKKS
ncbi:MAG: PilZ domain-containing protein [Firmicutes bacterium]|nr:PilZ domain-containing protein [Bacillota bacterium]